MENCENCNFIFHVFIFTCHQSAMLCNSIKQSSDWIIPLAGKNLSPFSKINEINFRKKTLNSSLSYSTDVASGMSAAAGALSRPMLVQLTTQDCWGPAASTQLQFAGHGLQLLPPSPGGPEPRASRHQSATNRKEQKLSLGTQTPCFRLDKVCPFPQGIAHSHLNACDGSKSSQSEPKEHVLLSCEGTNTLWDAPFPPTRCFLLTVGYAFSESRTDLPHSFFFLEEKKVLENFLSPPPPPPTLPLSTNCSSTCRR